MNSKLAAYFLQTVWDTAGCCDGGRGRHANYTLLLEGSAQRNTNYFFSYAIQQKGSHVTQEV